MPSSKDETLKVNLRQKEFYNKPSSHKNRVTAIWSTIRNRFLSDFREQYGIKERVYEEHKNWLGDLSGKKILDLGCLRGNALSIYMAQRAGQYIGIDLSDVAIEILNKRLAKNQCVHARAEAIDFYSDHFTEREFDIIYAYGVLHHFPDTDKLFSRLEEVLKPGGMIIAYDPLQTSLPVKILRLLYRPFQSDKEWEWPFNKKTLHKIAGRFEVVALHGVLGTGKWALLLNLFPFAGMRKRIMGLIEKDWNIRNMGKPLYSCMQVTMLLRRKENANHQSSVSADKYRSDKISLS